MRISVVLARPMGRGNWFLAEVEQTFTVQAAASAPDGTFGVDDWVFMVTRASRR